MTPEQQRRNAEKTLRSNILMGIADTGNAYTYPGVDCAGLVESIAAAICHPAGRWVLAELATELQLETTDPQGCN